MAVVPATSLGIKALVYRSGSYSGTAVTNIANNVQATIKFDSFDGGDSTLLNQSSPNAPVVNYAGQYIILAQVTTGTLTASGYAIVTITGNSPSGSAAVLGQLVIRADDPLAASKVQQTCVAAGNLAVGNSFAVAVTNQDGTSARNFQLTTASVFYVGIT